MLLAAFIHVERRAEEPILPLRLLTNRTRSSANAARALLYAGFYGLFYFMAQFLQDVQGYSPLRAGAAFLPMPVSVFLFSQLTSRVLLRRLPEKVVMVMGTTIATVGLLLATRVGDGTGYLQIIPSLVLIGAGSGMTFVSLTNASLHEVEPEIAGAASGLVNVSQQLGAAVGLAVLVTAFNAMAGKAQLTAGAEGSAIVHPLDAIFGVAALFTVGSLATVLAGVRTPRVDLDANDDRPDECIGRSTHARARAGRALAGHVHPPAPPVPVTSVYDEPSRSADRTEEGAEDAPMCRGPSDPDLRRRPSRQVVPDRPDQLRLRRGRRIVCGSCSPSTRQGRVRTTRWHR